MKKFLTFFLIFTACVVLLGTMLVFDVVDFNIGQTQLTGFEIKKMDKVTLHNKIVEEVHDIGLHSYELVINTNPELINKILSEIKDSKSKLENLIKNNDLKGKKAQVEEDFKLEYIPALNNLIANFNIRVGGEGLTEEAINMYKTEIKEAHSKFVEAHNAFTNTLNEAK